MRSRVVGRRKGFGAHYSSAASASGALHWLSGERTAARTAGSCVAVRLSIGSRSQSPRRRSRGAASRVPRTCPAGRASPKASERTRCPLCIIPRRGGRAAVRVSEGARPERQHIYMYGLSLSTAYPRLSTPPRIVVLFLYCSLLPIFGNGPSHLWEYPLGDASCKRPFCVGKQKCGESVGRVTAEAPVKSSRTTHRSATAAGVTSQRRKINQSI